MKDKNDYLSKQKRVKNYGQIKDGDYIISVNTKKIGARFKLFIVFQLEEELKLLLVEINSTVLKEF